MSGKEGEMEAEAGYRSGSIAKVTGVGLPALNTVIGTYIPFLGQNEHPVATLLRAGGGATPQKLIR